MSLISSKNSPQRFLGRPASRCKKCLVVQNDSRIDKTGTLHYVNRMGGVQCLRCHPPKSDDDVLLRLTICEGVWIDAQNGFDDQDEQSIVQTKESDSRANSVRLERSWFLEDSERYPRPQPDTQDAYNTRVLSLWDDIQDRFGNDVVGRGAAGGGGAVAGAGVVSAADVLARDHTDATALNTMQVGCPYVWVVVRAISGDTRRTDYVHFGKIPSWATEWSCQQRGDWLPIPEFWRK